MLIRLFLLAFCMIAGVTSLHAAPIKVEHSVVPIAQPSKMSCWATSATILKTWKFGFQRPIKDVVSDAGPQFVAIYNASFASPPEGISPTDEKAFYAAIGLSVIQGQNPTIDGWGQLLTTHGPLSVTVDAKPGEGFIHALVVTGLDGDGTAQGTIVTYIDPDGGIKKDVWFSEFVELYEGSAQWPLQIIYNP